MNTNKINAESLETVHTHTHTHIWLLKKRRNNILNRKELFLNKISFNKCAKKSNKIYKDRLYAKVKDRIKLLQNSLSFLYTKEVIETKDKYA